MKELTLNTWMILLHANCLWLKAIGTMLFPYVIKSSSELINRLEISNDGKMCEECFTGITNYINLDEFCTWGCPVYALKVPLQ